VQPRPVISAVLAMGALAATLAILAVGGLGSPDGQVRGLDALGVVLAVLASLPLALRARAPLAGAAVVEAATVALVALRYPLDVPVGAVVAAYAVAIAQPPATARAPRGASLLLVAAVVPGVALALWARGQNPLELIPELAVWALVVGAACVAGDGSRLRRARLRDLQERLRITRREVEQDRRLAVAEERTRIARELHDSAGHAVNVILVQAGAARLLHDRDPAASRAALETIEEVARATIGEIDHLVRALRDGDERDVPTPAHPTALQELIDRYRSMGLEITADVSGTDRSPPPRVAWAAYRILQESLTNAARHGRGDTRVAVSFERPAVTMQVSNLAGGSAAARQPGGGHGLVGMRERASLLGGTLDVRPCDGRFELRAELPYGDGTR
jgi:signal transduction histidine kinase